jgi:hypothetical protein
MHGPGWASRNKDMQNEIICFSCNEKHIRNTIESTPSCQASGQIYFVELGHGHESHGIECYSRVKVRGSWNWKWPAPCLGLDQRPNRPHKRLNEMTAVDSLHY